MPSGLMNNVSMSDESHRLRESDDESGKAARRAGATVRPAADERKMLKSRTQSMDYVWRSGVAGGLAGCAVSNCTSFPSDSN